MMVKSIDRDYFARRALEEIERGERAASATIAAVHHDMAAALLEPRCRRA